MNRVNNIMNIEDLTQISQYTTVKSTKILWKSEDL